MKKALQEKPYRPTWDDEEVEAVRGALGRELEAIARRIASGRTTGSKPLKHAIWSMICKVSQAQGMGVTEATPPDHLEAIPPIVQDLEPLVEFARSSRLVRAKIFARLKTYFEEMGVEPKFLERFATKWDLMSPEEQAMAASRGRRRPRSR